METAGWNSMEGRVKSMCVSVYNCVCGNMCKLCENDREIVLKYGLAWK